MTFATFQTALVDVACIVTGNGDGNNSGTVPDAIKTLYPSLLTEYVLPFGHDVAAKQLDTWVSSAVLSAHFAVNLPEVRIPAVEFPLPLCMRVAANLPCVLHD